MDTQAARRARQKALKADLGEAYSDDEASPPEWADLAMRVRDESSQLLDDIAQETQRFVSDPDIRSALTRRERNVDRFRRRINELNEAIRRLNLIVPHARFTRPGLVADEVLRPLYRTPRESK